MRKLKVVKIKINDNANYVKCWCNVKKRIEVLNLWKKSTSVDQEIELRYGAFKVPEFA